MNRSHSTEKVRAEEYKVDKRKWLPADLIRGKLETRDQYAILGLSQTEFDSYI